MSLFFAYFFCVEMCLLSSKISNFLNFPYALQIGKQYNISFFLPLNVQRKTFIAKNMLFCTQNDGTKPTFLNLRIKNCLFFFRTQYSERLLKSILFCPSLIRRLIILISLKIVCPSPRVILQNCFSCVVLFICVRCLCYPVGSSVCFYCLTFNLLRRRRRYGSQVLPGG